MGRVLRTPEVRFACFVHYGRKKATFHENRLEGIILTKRVVFRRNFSLIVNDMH